MTEKMDGSYYAKGDSVWKAPLERRRADGSTGISLGSEVCIMTEFYDEQAPILAAILNAHEPMLDALKKWSHDGALQTFEDRERFRAEVRAIIAKVEGSND